jgi:hypothetical protein
MKAVATKITPSQPYTPIVPTAASTISNPPTTMRKIRSKDPTFVVSSITCPFKVIWLYQTMKAARVM